MKALALVVLTALLGNLAAVSPLDVSVQLTGEWDTEKCLIAPAIHQNGPSALRPFVELNCAALIESELFGALPGGRSTATRRIPVGS